MIPQAVRVRDMVTKCCPPGKDRDMVLRWIEPRARRATERESKRATIKANPFRAALEKQRSKRKGARQQADDAFAEFIRVRDTRLMPNGTRMGKCCTCEKYDTVRGIYGIQCGHWIPRGDASGGSWGTRYDERNSNGQCYRDNSKEFGNGEREKHEAFIAAKYGADVPDILRTKAKFFPKKPSEQKFREIAEEFKKKTAELIARER